VQWFRDGLKAIGAASEIDLLAQQGAGDSGVIFVPALSGLGTPHWEPRARGTIFGLTRATSVADLARATIEGVGFQVADLIDAINTDSPVKLQELRVDGGMARSDPFLQFQADLLGLPLRRSPQTESTALGAALLAGLGAGVWPNPEAAADLLRAGAQVFTPRQDDAWRTRAMARWREAVATVVEHYGRVGLGE
jgi:glycerol kinase